MPYQAQEWTVSGLSVELKIDRRTAAKRLERVAPCRTEGVAKYYWMADAAPALLEVEKRGPRSYDGGPVLSLEAERARLAKEQADKLERERLVDEGRLLAADLVREALSRCFSSVNTKLGALPSKLAHVLRPDDPRTARRHLELAVEEMRAELRAVGVRGVEGWEGEPRH